MMTESNNSPRIEALKRELGSGNKTALDTFWSEITEQGTPLIEPIDGDDSNMLVTFLWRGADDIQNVFVMFSLAEEDADSCYLVRLQDTDVWYKSFTLRKDVHSAYIFSLNNPSEPWTAESWVEHQAAGLALPDPLNPKKVLGSNTIFVQESILRMPSAPLEPWLIDRSDIPAGQINEHTYSSSMLDNKRKVWVYTPPGYSTDANRYGWALFLDGGAYYDLCVNVMLDNLIARKKIPPLVAIFVRNVSHGDRHIEMSCNPHFARFLAEELMPWIRNQYHITNEPGRTIIAGESYSGLAAAFSGLCYPDVFGNVLAQSSAFFWYQGMDREPDKGEDTEPDWLIRQFVKAEKLPLCFHLDVGAYETGTQSSGKAYSSKLNTNRHMRDVLRAKGYPVHYVEFSGGHDFVGWRGCLPDALIWLANTSEINEKGT
jgi:enterochelin esterase family protein